ncbi:MULTISPECIES: NAD(P)H-hydrate dehydratase [unclassified Actinotalea]|uniref:NAD(P)H-hydrate dehydratase n=1 Tax=unclassified Actinotalea TaxID=2638618 RepID=UPI0015F7364E|nr:MULTISPECIES: NAD(P)H-hydrate dehydratase [unclassified Actinotalea]
MARSEPITPATLRAWPLPRDAGSKDERGSVLVVGGARETPGAAMLAGIAALRVGAGRLTFAVAESVATAVAVAVPESGAVGLPETAGGLLDGAGTDRLAPNLERARVLVVGPGLAGADETLALLETLLPLVGSDTQVVLDAFALGVLPSVDDALVARLAGRLLLTPNGDEGARLLDGDEDDPVAMAPRIARRYGAVVTCRGAVADPDGALHEASTGNGGLATSGSGDVLVGAVAGVLARGATPLQAACWGTHLHGASGGRLAARVAQRGYLARELLEELPSVLTELEA